MTSQTDADGAVWCNGNILNLLVYAEGEMFEIWD